MVSEDAFLELPPSAKLVAYVLENANEPLRHEDIREESLLNQRTVRFALRCLEDAGIVQREICIMDARKRKFSLVTESIPATL